MTSPGRTILDLAATLDRTWRSSACSIAPRHTAAGRQPPPRCVGQRHPRAIRGASPAAGRPDRRTTSRERPLRGSELEERFLAALPRRRPAPGRAATTTSESLEKVDFVFVGHGLLVETDSWRGHHSSRESFESDRRRDAIHAAAGWRTLRFTHRQIEEEPAEVSRAIATALALALGPHANFARPRPLGPDDQPPTVVVSTDW